MHSSTTGGQPSRSDRFRVLGSTGAHLRLSSALCASCRPAAIHRLAPTSLLRLGRQPTSDSHRTSSFSSAGDGTRLAPHAAPAPPAGFHIRIAPAASALRLHRRLTARLAPCDPLSGSTSDALLASTEPCIAGLAVDEYSVSTGSCIFRNHPAKTTSGLRRLLVFWCVQRSLSGLRPRFHPLVGLAAILRLSPAVHSARLAGNSLPACADCVSLQLPAIHSDTLLGHQLNETVRPFNLWIQVQKSS